MGVASSSPILTQGDQTDFEGAGLNIPDGRYLISVLADGYKLDGAHFTMPLADGAIVEVLHAGAPGARRHDPGCGLRGHLAGQRCPRPAGRARPCRLDRRGPRHPGRGHDRRLRRAAVRQRRLPQLLLRRRRWCRHRHRPADRRGRPLPHDLRSARPRRSDRSALHDRRAARRRQYVHQPRSGDGGDRGQGQDPGPRHEPLHARGHAPRWRRLRPDDHAGRQP